jgi:hypothetical protein
MILTVLVAVAELERSLIAERVKADLRNARAKGKHLGRPKVALDAARIASLRARGLGWKRISKELSVGSWDSTENRSGSLCGWFEKPSQGLSEPGFENPSENASRKFCRYSVSVSEVWSSEIM